MTSCAASSLSLLIVKDRARAPYRHIVVATDFSDSALQRSALADLFLGSIARQILEYLPCDALVVRGTSAAVEADTA